MADKPEAPPVTTPETPVTAAPPSGAPSPPTPPAPPPSTPAKAGAFKFTGTGPGGPFNIDGEGFGLTKGRVTIGGRDATVTRWTDTSIKGFVPPDLKPGPIEVTMDDKKVMARL